MADYTPTGGAAAHETLVADTEDTVSLTINTSHIEVANEGAAGVIYVTCGNGDVIAGDLRAPVAPTVGGDSTYAVQPMKSLFLRWPGAARTAKVRLISSAANPYSVQGGSVDAALDELDREKQAAAELGGAGVTAAVLKGWTSGESYEPTTITRDANDVVTSAVVVWPDGSSGTFTATTVNSTYNTVDAFTITHADSAKTVTQSAVTRNSNGAVTAKPALTVS